jgi:acetoin utilization deacetylase AcuC-like enzyme
MALYYRHPSSLAHDTGPHPENAERIRAIEAVLDDAGWAGMSLEQAPTAERELLELAHTPGHVESIERFCAAGGGMIDMDTSAVEASWEAALRAAGGAVEASRRLLAGEGRFAFCGLRPPGHHAESSRAMGFCLFNNAAIASAAAIASGSAERVLVLDWDVHHGNGTEEIFRSRSDVLYASIHQSPLYPGTGHPDHVGEGAGEGYTVNLPVPPGAGGEEFLSLVQRVVVPIARRFAPGLIVISAGYDAHAADPLANCKLTEADYAAMAASIRDVGLELGTPVLVCLEGGYAVDALAASVLATVRALGEERPPENADSELAAQARERLRRHWQEALS